MRLHSRTLLAALLASLPALSAAAQNSDPPAVKPRDLAKYDAQIKAADRLHWSFLPPKKPDVPRVKNAGWVQNAIDAFVLAKLEEQGWQPPPAAEARVLVRRLYFDLNGLPPTPEAVVEFGAARDGTS